MRIQYIIRRILISVPILLAVYTIVFFLVRSMPGGPAVAVLGDYASKEAVEALEAQMGLDLPLWVQYVRFLWGLLRWDLGRSLINGFPVAPQIAEVLPYTLELTISAIIFGVIFGIPLGIFTALRRNSLLDYLARTFSLGGISMPEFFIGILLIMIFSIKLDLFPVMGGGNLYDLHDNLSHLFLPALTLGLMMTGYVTRTLALRY